MLLEQVASDYQTEENKNVDGGVAGEKLEDGNVTSKQKGWWPEVEKIDEELLEKEAGELADKIMEDPETEKQINQLIKLGDKYKNKELMDVQSFQYENLMKSIKNELDQEVPRAVEMNKEKDTKYYMSHPLEAWEKATEIASENYYQNMTDIEVVSNVMNGKDYLSKENRQKLNNAVNKVINNLDDEVRSVLELKK